MSRTGSPTARERAPPAAGHPPARSQQIAQLPAAVSQQPTEHHPAAVSRPQTAASPPATAPAMAEPDNHLSDREAAAPPRSQLWQRFSAEAHTAQPLVAIANVPDRSAGATGLSWLNNRRPAATAPPAQHPRAGHEAQAAVLPSRPAAPVAPAATALPAARPQPSGQPAAKAAEELSYDFGDDYGLSDGLSAGGMGLTSVMALVAPPPEQRPKTGAGVTRVPAPPGGPV